MDRFTVGCVCILAISSLFLRCCASNSHRDVLRERRRKKERNRNRKKNSSFLPSAPCKNLVAPCHSLIWLLTQRHDLSCHDLFGMACDAGDCFVKGLNLEADFPFWSGGATRLFSAGGMQDPRDSSIHEVRWNPSLFWIWQRNLNGSFSTFDSSQWTLFRLQGKDLFRLGTTLKNRIPLAGWPTNPMGDHKAEKWVFDSCHKRSPFWNLQMAFPQKIRCSRGGHRDIMKHTNAFISLSPEDCWRFEIVHSIFEGCWIFPRGHPSSSIWRVGDSTMRDRLTCGTKRITLGLIWDHFHIICGGVRNYYQDFPHICCTLFVCINTFLVFKVQDIERHLVSAVGFLGQMLKKTLWLKHHRRWKRGLWFP